MIGLIRDLETQMCVAFCPRLAWTNPRPHLSLPRLYRSLCQTDHLNGEDAQKYISPFHIPTYTAFFKSCRGVSQAGRTISTPRPRGGEKVFSSQRITVCDGQTHAGADAKRAQIGKSYPNIRSPTPSQKLGGKNWE